MNFKNKYNLLALVFTILVLFSCKTELDKEAEQLNQKADSLSIKLNSPELKAVNAELLKDPNNPDLYNKRAGIYLALKQLPESAGDALRAIKLDSTKSEYYNTLVDAYFAQNKTRQAKDLLEIMENKFPENTEALLKLGELYFLIKQYQKGIDYVNKALKLDENLARAYYIKGSIYKESGDTAKAISSLETAIEQNNKYEEAFYDLGIIYASRKNPVALDYYNNALKVNPSNNNIRYAQAKLLQDLEKTDEAITAYEAIVATNKDCDNCLYNLGAIYLELKKDNQKAVDYFTKALSVNPNYADAYFARGYAYSKMKDKDNAKADYNACLKLMPNHEAALLGLRSL